MVMKPLRRFFRGPGKYVQAVLRWKRLSFNEAPPIFGNSKPKSGSHLLLQILNGFTKIMPYKYVEAEPSARLKKREEERPKEEILKELKQIPQGVIGWGYVEASPENSLFCASLDRSITLSIATRAICLFRRSFSPRTCRKSMGCMTFTSLCLILASG